MKTASLDRVDVMVSCFHQGTSHLDFTTPRHGTLEVKCYIVTDHAIYWMDRAYENKIKLCGSLFIY